MRRRWWIVALVAVVGATAACVGAGLFIIADNWGFGDGRLTVRHYSKPDKEQWCYFARITNGTRLVEITANWAADGTWERQDGPLGPKSLVSTFNNGAPRTIRADATILIHGLEANPAQPDAATLAAAQRVDAYVAAECGSPR